MHQCPRRHAPLSVPEVQGRGARPGRGVVVGRCCLRGPPARHAACVAAALATRGVPPGPLLAVPGMQPGSLCGPTSTSPVQSHKHNLNSRHAEAKRRGRCGTGPQGSRRATCMLQGLRDQQRAKRVWPAAWTAGGRSWPCAVLRSSEQPLAPAACVAVLLSFPRKSTPQQRAHPVTNFSAIKIIYPRNQSSI